MLNFSTGGVNMAAACGAAQVETIVTSRRFIERAKMEATRLLAEAAGRLASKICARRSA